MPKVSVIIPVYGVEKYIQRCARSLFEQTLDDIEYLFIDDCTPDKSIVILQQVLEEYPNRKSHVIIHRMEKNSGQAAVRKWGIENATGEYIIHCDSDDWVDIDMYRAMYYKAIEEDADLVVCDYMMTDGESIQRRVNACHTKDINIFFENIIYQRDSWSLWNKLFRKTAYNREIIFPKYAMGEDSVLCIQLVWHSKTMVYINKPFYNYFSNEQSITRNVSEKAIEKRFYQSVMNAEDILTFFKNNDIYEKYTEAIECLLINKKNILLPLIRKKKYFVMWWKTFPQLNFNILTNRSYPFSSKVKHLIALSPLRKFYYGIRNFN